ncbi:MAG: sulfurtransferase [Gaiella sp.]
MTDVSLDELRELLTTDDVVVVDVRSPAEHAGLVVAPCDPRPGRIPGSVGLPLDVLFGLDPAGVAERLGRPDAVRVVAYCHSGQRSAMAVEVLAGHGYDARNYVGSWHEWSRDEALPAETG